MELLSFKKYIKPKHLLFMSIVIGLFLFSFDSVLAAASPTGASPTPTTNSTEAVQKVITAVHTAMQIMGALLGVITALVTMLIHPGWYNGEAFNMQTYFHEIWILVSNVVYFIFAFLLIWVAFMNIIGKGEGGNYELKKALPRIVVGILMVPISWFLVQFIVSLSSVLMVAILSLPFDTFKDKPIFQGNTTEVCTKFVLDLGGAPTAGAGAAGAGGTTTPTKYFDCASKTSLSEVLKAEDSIYGIVGMYTYGILQLDKLNDATITTLQGAKTLTGVVLKAMFDAIFILVYIILMVAIFIALFMRGVYIWMFMMLSPLFGLFYFLDDKGDSALGGLSKFNLKEFIKIALIPVWVGAALSFGILFLFVTTKGLNESAGKKDTGSTFIECGTENGGKSCTITAGKFAFQVKGSAGSTLSALNDGKEFTASALGAILINFFGLAVLWMAVMAALKGSEISGTAIAPIESFGKSIGETALKAPQYLPILPGGLSPSGLGKVGSNITGAMESFSSNKTAKWMEQNTPWLDPNRVKTSTDIQNRRNMLATNSTVDATRDVRKSMQDLGSVEKMAIDQGFKDFLKEFAKTKVSMSDAEISAYGDLSNKTQLTKFIADVEKKLKGTSSEGILLPKGTLLGTLTPDGINSILNGQQPQPAASPQAVTATGAIDTTSRAGTININNQGTPIDVAINLKDPTKPITDVTLLSPLRGRFTKDQFKDTILKPVGITDQAEQDKLIAQISGANGIPNFFN